MEKVVFIADAHLTSQNKEEYKDLLSFLDGLMAFDHLDALFILGDLFDFFVGFPKVVFYEHLEMLHRLKSLSLKGISIFYFEGNHDFFLRKLNKLGFPVTFIEQGMDIYLGGKKFYVSHGDRIDRTDYAHRLLTFLVKNPATNLLSYLLPPHLVYDFAHAFSRFSRNNISSKRPFTPLPLREFAKSCANFCYSGAILGHYHKSMILEPTDDKGIPIYLVGSWKEDRSYLLWEGGRLSYHNFS